ncbi:hypothetical protein OF83DRAFT_1064363 [Amylostereum chailletii]|nr:hypothetical protein OF83DRAFT_1064363 [Amylostereum chailletii]
MEARYRRGRLARFLAPDLLTASLRLLWVILVIWAELGAFYYTLSGCNWPDKSISLTTAATPKPTQVLLVADAKVPMPPNGSRSWSRLLSDVYVRKAWAATRRLRPDVIVFLGDMLAYGGSIKSDSEHAAYVRSFHDTFPVPSGTDVYYVPGNTDVGLGVANAFTKHVRDRYIAHFGPLNQVLHISNHTLVLIDAPGLVDEDYSRAGEGTSFENWVPIRHGPIEFVKTLADSLQEVNPPEREPLILLSHIPLHRPESKKCGPLREKGTIRRGVGRGWQSTLGKQTSTFLINNLRPVMVFSGDNTDYCDIRHALADSAQEVQEVTLKSFSQSRHIDYPGFQLLSLLPEGSSTLSSITRHAHIPCSLPQTRTPFGRLYIPFLCITIAVLFIAHLRRARVRVSFASPLPSHTQPSPIPPKLDPPSPYSASSTYSYSYPFPSSPGSRLAAIPESPRINGFDGLQAPQTPWNSWSTTPSSPTDPLPSGIPRGRFLSPTINMPPDDDAAPLGVPNRTDATRRLPRLRMPHSLSGTDATEGSKWTWSFTFRGQRRRLALRLPSSLLRLCIPREGGTRKMKAWRTTARNLAQILWVPAGVWLAMMWWFSGV